MPIKKPQPRGRMAFLPGVSRPGPLLELGGGGMVCLVVIDTPDATVRMVPSSRTKAVYLWMCPTSPVAVLLSPRDRQN